MSPDLFWAHYAYGRQHRCQEDPVNSPSIGLEETLRMPPHHMAEHPIAGSEIHNLTWPEAMDMAQNRSLWRMWSTYGAMQSWVACQKRQWWRCSEYCITLGLPFRGLLKCGCLSASSSVFYPLQHPHICTSAFYPRPNWVHKDVVA